MSHKFILAITVCFALFFCFIIFSANTGQELIFFKLVKAIPLGDKIGHFSLMGILTILVNLSLKNSTINIHDYKLFVGSTVVFVLITIEEFSQINLNRRTFDMVDLMFNYMGIALASWVSLRLKSQRMKLF